MTKLRGKQRGMRVRKRQRCESLVALAERLKPDLRWWGLRVAGRGIRDKFRIAAKMRLVGPSRRDARLEGSKIFAKEFMGRHRIPTPTLYGRLNRLARRFRALDAGGLAVVVKADGLCGGKGVLVAETRAEAAASFGASWKKHALGQGGSRILLETALQGEELFLIVLTDGGPSCRCAHAGHKRVFDGDRGPNTGGMGRLHG